LREVVRGRFVKLGAELARSAFEHVGKTSKDKTLESAARTLRLPDIETLLARLGSAELTAQDVVQAVYPDLVSHDTDEIETKRALIGLSPGQSFDRAPCCQPLPGERIVGITFRGKGVTVHSIDCAALEEFEDQPSRWLDLHWASGNHPAIYTVTLELTIGNDAGVLGRICTLIGERKANITDLVFVDRKPDFFRLRIDIDLRDAEHLHSLMSALEAESDVASVARRRDPTLAARPAAEE